MLDRELIRRNPDLVRSGAARKGLHAPVDEFLQLDSEWRSAETMFQERKAELNRVSKSIGQLFAEKRMEEANAAKISAKEISDAIPQMEQQIRELEAALREVELQFPNLPAESTPNGLEEHENVFVRAWGEKVEPAEEPEAHWDIATRLGLLDFPRSAKISGSGFALYTGLGARLQRALFTYMIDLQTTRHGYHELYPPYLVNRASLVGTGNLPKFEDDLYRTTDDLFLVPTAEVPVTNYYRDEILDGGDLPIRLAAYSACFRREAGAAGKDTRGIQRIHQFDKVELVWFCRPEDSYEHLETLTSHAEAVVQSLGLHYRVVELCAGELGAKGAKCYDVEIWSPALGRYLEISSCSNFEAYQSRRANIRFRRAPGERPEFVHVLNGSGLACPRLFAVLLETGLRPDGSVTIPEPLRPYMGTDRIA